MACKTYVIAEIATHLSELYLRLSDPRQTVMSHFEAWYGFVAKPAAYKQGIQTASFCYFKHLKKLLLDL